MKNISMFYKFLKIIIVVADIYVISILCILLVTAFLSGEDIFIVLILTFACVFVTTIVEIFLIKYYQNIVISINFTEEHTIICTNKEKYILSNNNFIRIKEETSNGRTYIFYNDGFKEKKFVYIMRYAFRTYHLDIAEMQRHMPYAIFEIER